MNANSILENPIFTGSPSFCDSIQAICKQKKLVPGRVIQSARIARTYGHQLFNGTRQPSRDKVLQLAISMGLTVDAVSGLPELEINNSKVKDLHPLLELPALQTVTVSPEMDGAMTALGEVPFTVKYQ